MKVGGFLVLSLLFLSAMGQLPSQDILALLEFRKGIKRDPTGYVLDSWNDESIDFNGCPSSWNGIVCNGGNVAGVVLDNLGLSAEANLSVFANLTKLVKLSMANNSISGKIPDNIADFESLEYLDLSNNLFSSPLPPGIGKLHGLKSLSLGSNNFSGTIPDEIAGLASVRSVDLSANSFSGPIPDSLAKMSALVSLNLSGNGFAKTPPKGLDLLSSLDVIDLSGNMLEGRLDAEFLLLTGASHVDLSGNMFTSSDPRRVLSRISDTVKYLNLSRNRLTGSLVSSGELFESLKVLDLSYNELSGELPGFSFVYDLQVLMLSNNGFSGEIPNNLLKGDTLVLTELDLSSNNLSGPISMITSTNLRVLNLSSNVLSGDLPMQTGSCTVLDLSNNRFQGNLTRMLKWDDIEFLDLSRNRLSGPILESLTPQFLRLNHLNLSHNSLTGPLPKAMTRYPKLRALDLSSNGFDGAFLESWVTMPALEEIRFDNNALTGPIELSSPLPSDSKLKILDLSKNRLSGFFPGQLVSTPIQSLSIAGNNISGSLPTSISSMTSLTSLDISTNRFTGPLPENLPATLASFNASFNDLSGVVPENLRRFPPSSFFPGNSHLQIPSSPPGVGSGDSNNNKRTKKPVNTLVKVVIAVSCVAAIVVVLLLAVFLHYLCVSRRDPSAQSATEKKPNPSQTLTVSAADLKVSSGSEPRAMMTMSSSDEKASPSKSGGGGSQVSWSPERLAGDLYFLDDTIRLTAEELSRAPAEVLGRSSHGTSYRASLDDGAYLTVKWLREGVAKQKKEFGKEAKKFTNIRHPNVVGLKGYYWGPSQHEKLILSDYISPGSLATFLYDKPGRQGPPLTWAQRLKIAVDVARGLNYLHFDRAVPHGNLKATNVLLDGPDLNARVADYCLHRLMTQAGTIEQILDSGVLGYRAPELAASKKPVPSFKSDVYAFGIVLLELLTARSADADLAEWVRARPTDCFDAPLAAEMVESPAVEKGVREALAIALRCLRSVSDRPGIKTVYEDLSSI